MIDEIIKNDALLRLKKIEGQVKGVQKMIEGEKYCIDIINQINAVRRALESLALKIMEKHIETCVSHDIKMDKNSKKIEELMETINKFVR